MDGGLPKYGLSLLILMTAVTSGCSRTAAPTAPEPAVPVSASITAQPHVVSPEYMPGPCVTGARFGLRLNVIFTGHDLIVRGLHFSLQDRHGQRIFPEFVSPSGSSIPGSFPSSLPAPGSGATLLPNSSPVPIPGLPPVSGVLVNGRTPQSFPFFVGFGCGVAPEGALLIRIDTASRTGTFGASEVIVRLGS